MAVDRNAARFLLDLGTAAGGTTVTFSGAGGVLGPSPIAYQNAIYRTQLAGPDVDRVIDEVRTELDAQGVPGSWHVGPLDEPADLVARLQAHGFDDGGEDIGMVCDLTRMAAAPVPPGATIHEVEDEAGLAEWVQVLSDGFGEGPVEAEWAASAYRRIGFGPSSAHRLIVAELDGAPAAAGASLLDGAEVGLYFIATRRDARRRGLGSAVTRRLAAMGGDSGARLAVLGASPAGRPVYARLGFSEVSRIRIMEHHPVRRSPAGG